MWSGDARNNKTGCRYPGIATASESAAVGLPPVGRIAGTAGVDTRKTDRVTLPRSPAVDLVVSRATSAVTAALARVRPPAPAYAVGLWGSGEADLDPAVICIGLEPDRVAALAGATPDPPRRRIWNVSEYAMEARVEPDLRDDESFLAAEQEALATLHAADIWDPQRWIFNRIARAVAVRRPLAPVTDDFVVFAFDDGFGRELLENLRFSGGTAVALLEERSLLPRT
jgi:hypothetical protein